MKKLTLLLMLMATIILSCSSDDDNQNQIIEMRINHYQNTGFAVGPVLTLLVQEGDEIGTENWTNFYSNIEGFNYQPGAIHNLSVMVEKIDNPPADGSSIKYTLLEIKSSQEVNNETNFNIDLKKNGVNFLTSDNGLKLLNQINIDCNNLCNELETVLQNQDIVIGTFSRNSANEIKLIGLE